MNEKDLEFADFTIDLLMNKYPNKGQIKAWFNGNRFKNFKYVRDTLLMEKVMLKDGAMFIINPEIYDYLHELKSYSRYRKHKQNLRRRTIKKEIYDYRISEFQSRTRYLPHIISVISIIFASIALFLPNMFSKNEESQTVPTEAVKQLKNKQPNEFSARDTFQTNEEIDRTKNQQYD